MVDLNQACVRHVQLMRLVIKQKRVLIASLTLFSEIGFEKLHRLTFHAERKLSEGTVLAILKQRRHTQYASSLVFDQVIPETIELFTDQKVLYNDESVTAFFGV